MNLRENYLDDNNLFSHRKCYQYVTMKTSLEKIEQQAEQQTEVLRARLDAIDTFEGNVDVPKRISRSQQGGGSNHQAILPKECILCKRNKYVKRKLEDLIKFLEMCAIKSLLDPATDKQDFEMIFLASTDFIAAEAHYHTSGYKNYTVKRKEVKSDTVSSESEVI